MNGILLALQFFTVLPIKKELLLGRKEVTSMYSALPFVGAAIGFIVFLLSVFLLSSLNLGTLLVAVVLVVAGIVLTGGLHVDGFADTGDAFFSYRDRLKRLEILEDPRIGAFGTLSILMLVLLKIALLNEVLMKEAGSSVLFIAVPFLARGTMNLYFTTSRLAKDTGIAHFFKEKIANRWVNGISLLGGILMLIAMGVVLESVLIPSVFLGVLALSLVLYKRWSVKHFGGVTGDLAGAFIEGLETILWATVIVFI
ncbi:adenosylcobinamide-GDP ribazoletransferase [Sporosarcina siberiensis]|uniref:Adenosylcobinamide-GDP ribazoletransferase n=1 Tax=Sporosarcina siberiensis TaxID=1365606 RepID=A0ABW4SIQ5_9BACL